MYDDDNDIIIIEDDEDDGGAYRNAIVVRGGRDHRGGGGATRGTRIVRPSRPRAPAPVPAPVQAEEVKKEKSAIQWLPDVLRGLAAVMPLPVPPAADPDVAKNITNLLMYLGATSQVAQRKEQLHTLAAIAERHI